MMEKTKRLLKEASRGNAAAAYYAAHALQDEKYDEVIVQAHYRRAAELGYKPAMRILGLYGIYGSLIKEDSTVYNKEYDENPSKGIKWIIQAMQAGDVVSKYIYGKCLQYGIGIVCDKVQSEIIISEVVESISFELQYALSELIGSISQSNRKSTQYVLTLTNSLLHQYCTK